MSSLHIRAVQEGTSQHNHLDKGNLSTIRVVDFLKMHGELQFLSSSSQAPLKGEKTWGLPFSSPGWVEGQGWCAWAALTWGRFAYPQAELCSSAQTVPVCKTTSVTLSGLKELSSAVSLTQLECLLHKCIKSFGSSPWTWFWSCLFSLVIPVE